MRNKIVLITGCTGGIGVATAEKFAKNGWDILCHYNSSKENALKLKSMISSLGRDCYLFKADFSSKKQIKIFNDKIKNFPISSVINNAGTYIVNKKITEISIEEIIDTFMVNAFAPLLLTPSIFTGMKERQFGRIVNISSIAAKYGGAIYSAHYGCSKLALEGLTKTLAREGAEYNVLVNTIRPGVINTGFHKKFLKDMTKRIAMIPMKKIGIPEDIADMAYYLGSDMNKFITNETIAISGGE